MDIRLMLKQATQAQKKITEAQKTITACGTASGSMVKLTLNGAKELINLSISKDAIDINDPTITEDLIMIAYKDALNKINQEMSKITDSLNLNIPGIL